MIKNLLECGLWVLVRSLLPGTINVNLKNASRTVTTSYFVLSTLLCFSLDPALTLSSREALRSCSFALRFKGEICACHSIDCLFQ